MEIKVFISSTSRDLQDYRLSVVHAIEQLHGYRAIHEDRFSRVSDSTSWDVQCRKNVADCDLFIGILGFYFGSIPPGCEASYTQREYEHAKLLGKDVRMFLASESCQFSAEIFEKAIQDWDRQLRFRDLVTLNDPPPRPGFIASADLALNVIQTIHVWHQETQTRRAFERAHLFQDLLKFVLEARSLPKTFANVVEKMAVAVGVERASIWLFHPDPTTMTCQYFFPKSENLKGLPLLKSEFPAYFDALTVDEVVDPEDALIDDRTSELSAYLTKYNVKSLLDVPITVGGELRGIICHEHCGSKGRRWSAEDTAFAISIASLISLAIEQYEKDRTRLKKGELIGG
jgi:uncharacterized protein DUF4062/GAF domain-containing protein